jgi:hypothetical protein
VSAHEVVLPEEVPRLKRAAVVLLVIDVLLFGGSLTLTFATVGPASLDELAAPFILLVSLCTSVAAIAAFVGCVGVATRPSNPAWRRLAFVGALPVAALLISSLLFLTFVAEMDRADYAAYVMVVLVTAAAVWSVYVFWPTVQLDSGTSSGNRPHALSGSMSSTPSS